MRSSTWHADLLEGTERHDETVEAELSVWIAQQRPVNNLNVSADTLCYWGARHRCVRRRRPPSVRAVDWSSPSSEHRPASRLISSTRVDAGTVTRGSTCATVVAGAALDRIALETVVLRREVGDEDHGLLASAERPI